MLCVWVFPWFWNSEVLRCWIVYGLSVLTDIELFIEDTSYLNGNIAHIQGQSAVLPILFLEVTRVSVIHLNLAGISWEDGYPIMGLLSILSVLNVHIVSSFWYFPNPVRNSRHLLTISASEKEVIATGGVPLKSSTFIFRLPKVRLLHDGLTYLKSFFSSLLLTTSVAWRLDRNLVLLLFNILFRMTLTQRTNA